ncbi:MAG: DUF2935 domain-containing protein [Mollicutes bacterium]|jgi:hypothetical protein|nr:DUF2935 domain-containing protein [Mollicutes bacterium]
MLSNEDILKYSLENGLINVITLRSFCLNIYFAILINDEEHKNTAKDFYDRFTKLTEELIKYADGNLSKDFLDSGAVLTKYSIPLVELTEKLFDVKIITGLTQTIDEIKTGTPQNVSEEIVEQISTINKVALVISLNFKEFLKEVFEKEKNNQLFSYSYPFLIRKMIEDTEFYILILERLIRKIDLDPTFVNRSEYQAVDLIRAYNMFLRSFIDPTRADLIIKAQSYVVEAEKILDDYDKLSLSPENQKLLTIRSQKFVDRVALFLESIIEELLNKQVYLIVEPIFLDNMLRSVNSMKYFIFDLETKFESISEE